MSDDGVRPVDPAVEPGAAGGGDGSSSSLSRRRFLVAGVVGAAGLVALGGAVAARSRSSAPPAAELWSSGFAVLFGDREPLVAALGQRAIDDGVAPGSARALLALLPAGVTAGADDTIELDDPARFAAGLAAATSAELAEGSLVVVDGFPLTPTEAATCAACALAVPAPAAA